MAFLPPLTAISSWTMACWSSWGWSRLEVLVQGNNRLKFVQVILAKLLDLRYVGFKNSSLIKLPLYDYIDLGKKEEQYERSWLSTNQLKFLSHNVWCHYLQQWYAPSARRRLDCLLNAIAQNGYDVVMIQELFLLRIGPFAITRNLEYFVARMRMMGYTLGADPRASLPFWGQNSGLCTFSRVDLVGKTESQSFLHTAERVCVKGFVRTDVKLSNDRTLTIVNTHMDSKAKKPRLTTSQAFQIKEHVLDRLYRNDPTQTVAVVVAGDFNVCSRKTKDLGEAYADLQKIFMPLVDVFGPSLSGGDSKPTRRPTRKLLGWYARSRAHCFSA
eukprot:754582-Hanusia_phi.AAC.19